MTATSATYQTAKDPSRAYQLRARRILDASQRWAAYVDGYEVGRGFATSDEALERAYDHARTLAQTGRDDRDQGRQ